MTIKQTPVKETVIETKEVTKRYKTELKEYEGEGKSK